MFGRLATLFHKESRRLFEDNVFIPSDDTRWPESWKKTFFKEYTRMEKIELPKPQSIHVELTDALCSRKSTREYNLPISISKEKLSTLLYYSSGIRNTPQENQEDDWNLKRRFYPSGGARYPLELYVCIQNVSDIEKGIYHYNVKEHSLEKLLNYAGISDLKEALPNKWSQGSQLTLIITSVWHRNFMKYQDFGYRMICLEAGHMGQNILLVSEALGLLYCPLLAFSNTKIDKIFDIKKRGESSLYVIAIGK